MSLREEVRFNLPDWPNKTLSTARTVMEKTARALLPSFHLVLPTHSPYVYSISAKDFDTHLAAIAQYRPSSPGACALAFDDGHRSQFDYGLPLLQKHGLRAIFFSIVGWIGKKTDYMTSRQLRQLLSAGHEVQSHGLSHLPLTSCSDAELSIELTRSRSELQEKLGDPVEAISIPFGRWDMRVIRACGLAGYRRVYTSDPVGYSFDGVEAIGRFAVTRKTRTDQLRKVLAADPRMLHALRAAHTSKLLVRSVLGERSYDRIWGFLNSRKSLFAVSATATQVELP